MIFNSLEFLFFFLPLCLLIYYGTPMVARNVTLFILSLFFYAWGNTTYLVLMVSASLISYLGSLWMAHQKREQGRLFAFIGLVTFQILLLFVFKYLGFFFSNVNGLFGTTFRVERLAQPLGISFYTFQVLSYEADVYRRAIPGEKNLLHFLLYLFMFPQLASGPILRYGQLKPQLAPRKVQVELLSRGSYRFVLGFFKKVFLANSLHPLWGLAKSAPPGELSALFAWVGLLAFTLYIYFDFSGYMDMAIGVANLLGFTLPENFNYPYISRSISEFWRRWHMTLGAFFRDYIYIPLGGSRSGWLRYLIALFAVWFLTGLWHGASYNFILWGLFYGLLILLERLGLGALLKKAPAFVGNLYTLFFVMMGWLLFDTNTLGLAKRYFLALFASEGFSNNRGSYGLLTYLPVLLLGIFLCHPYLRQRLDEAQKSMSKGNRNTLILVMILLFLFSLAYLLSQNFSPSMYIGF